MFPQAGQEQLVPGVHKGEDALGGHGGLHHGQRDPVEGVELLGAVDTGGVQDLQRERRHHKLSHEEHTAWRGDAWYNERQNVVGHAQLEHELIEADGHDGLGDHHDAEDHGVEGVAHLPLIGHHGVGREGGEVDGEERGAGGNDNGVDQTRLGAEALALKHRPVFHEVLGGDEGDRVLLDLARASGGVDHHDDEGPDGQEGKEYADRINEHFDQYVAVAFIKTVH